MKKIIGATQHSVQRTGGPVPPSGMDDQAGRTFLRDPPYTGEGDPFGARVILFVAPFQLPYVSLRVRCPTPLRFGDDIPPNIEVHEIWGERPPSQPSPILKCKNRGRGKRNAPDLGRLIMMGVDGALS